MALERKIRKSTWMNLCGGMNVRLLCKTTFSFARFTKAKYYQCHFFYKSSLLKTFQTLQWNIQSIIKYFIQVSIFACILASYYDTIIVIIIFILVFILHFWGYLSGLQNNFVTYIRHIETVLEPCIYYQKLRSNFLTLQTTSTHLQLFHCDTPMNVP